MNVLASNPDLSLEGLFRALATGDSQPARVIIFRADKKIDLFQTGVRSPGYTATIRQVDVPVRPVAGDRLEVIEGRFQGFYQVRDVREDGHRLMWDLELGEAP